jgi:hypothetical protein
MVKIGDVVKLRPHITSEHLLTILLRFDKRQVEFLRQAKFRADHIFWHSRFGLMTRASMYWCPPFQPGLWLEWCDENYVKLGYLEVVDGS